MRNSPKTLLNRSIAYLAIVLLLLFNSQCHRPSGPTGATATPTIVSQPITSYQILCHTKRDTINADGRIYVDHDRVRLEFPIQDPTLIRILQQGQDDSIILLNRYKSFTHAGESVKVLEAMGLGNPPGQLIGSETIKNTLCNKYQLPGDPYNLYKIYVWLDANTMIPVYVESDDKTYQVDYHDLQIGPVAAELFQIPPDYHSMNGGAPAASGQK